MRSAVATKTLSRSSLPRVQMCTPKYRPSCSPQTEDMCPLPRDCLQPAPPFQVSTRMEMESCSMPPSKVTPT
ncbi:hypothetical protein SPRG_22255 [Saprolegnia parasitica CBS 223.65]|uniref:Uncharacterized protein n=1 Tax=Saprolegnia parasitica (strain CBS 223.65) TaxID=695850 RepID=A0A067CBM1_SAPPC|nr:hypothetical protein SPRG_22255 [Saprolegnia parasitica CBS 223.65]KDO23946.1 hypothetical protein SPRG_22255 [Saprolegnia parasitica CBS 223.65]|eukprot:XP_012205419.1 hypothetical protein SPRG_22255 [Saprolegnia parasitica CBS 223.65]